MGRVRGHIDNDDSDTEEESRRWRMGVRTVYSGTLGQLLVQRSRFHNEVDSTLRRRGRSWVVTGRIRAAAASRDAQALRSCRRFALDDGRLLIGPL